MVFLDSAQRRHEVDYRFGRGFSSVPPQQRRELRAKEFKEEWDRAAIEELVFSIDVENAEASVAEDRERILSKIKAIGFDQVNSQVESAVWTAYSGRGLACYRSTWSAGIR